MHGLLSDVSYALRQLRRNPGFTAVALITLALCLGANLTIFAVVDSILLRPLPFAQPERLVVLYNRYPNAGKNRDLTSITSYLERRGNIAAFEQIAALNTATSIVGQTGSTERTDVERVTPEFFSLLGVPLAKGRAFTESEMTRSEEHTSELQSHSFISYAVFCLTKK